jgi:hypothetical protein
MNIVEKSTGARDQRKFQRIKIPLTVEFTLRKENQKEGRDVSSSFKGRMEDISEEGLGLSTSTLQYTNNENVLEDTKNFLNRESLLKSRITVTIPLGKKKIVINGEVRRAELITIRNRPYQFITIGAVIEKMDKSDFELLKSCTGKIFKTE